MADPGPRVINSGVNQSLVENDIAELLRRQRAGMTLAHSRIIDVFVRFNESVNIVPFGFTLALHTNNVVYDNTAYPNGFGTLPTAVRVYCIDGVAGAGPGEFWRLDTFGDVTATDSRTYFGNCLKDGVYNIVVDGTKVSRAADFSKKGLNFRGTFHALFGDTNGATQVSLGGAATDWEARVNSADNLKFRTSFNNSVFTVDTKYFSDFDFDGDRAISSNDNFEFRTRFNKTLSWST